MRFSKTWLPMEVSEVKVITEAINQSSKDVDKESIEGILKIINTEDRKVAEVVGQAIPQIALGVEAFVQTYARGGKVFYVGAGTSGRLGVLDAAECPPTFGIPPTRIQAVLAGGMEALSEAREDYEDDPVAGKEVAVDKGFTNKDFIIGITASGETPFVLGCLEEARRRHCTTGAITNNADSTIVHIVDIPITAVVGPEVIAGSTRMKAATAQKLILNMLSTASMIRSGKVYENLMIDLQARNQKLQLRAERILQLLTDENIDTTRAALREANYEVKPALVMLKGKLLYEDAKQLLQQHNGHARAALEKIGVNE